MRRVNIGGRSRTEASVNNVTPSTPLLTTTGVAGAAGVDDGIAGHASGLEGRAEELEEELLVLGLVVLTIGVVGELSGDHVPLVPAGNVGGDTANLGGATGIDVDAGELLCSGDEVVVPAEPATVTGVDVSDHVGEVEGLQSVGDTLAVAFGGVLARLEVDVGDQVG